MRWSAFFIPTLRENPAEAEVASYQLLLRAGYARRAAAHVYSYLPLAQRSLLKIQQIIREEMDAIGGQEVFPAVPLCVPCAAEGAPPATGNRTPAATSKAPIASMALGDLRSYRQLPQIWYRLQRDFRDERSKPSQLRAHPVLMKESYSFDLDASGLDRSYRNHREAYCRIFDRCGLEYTVAEAWGGDGATECFAIASEAGEETIVRCAGCTYAATLDCAVSRANAPLVPDADGDFVPEEFHTPGQKTIGDVSRFTRLPTTSQMKSLVVVADGVPVLVMLRGDHQLSETKLAAALHAAEIRPAIAAEIFDLFGANPGSLGPVGVKGVRILADLALQGRRNMIGGANRDGYHLRNVTPGEDFVPEYVDLRQAMEGDACAQCAGSLHLRRAVEVGRISKLGADGAAAGLRVLDENGNEVAPAAGSYEIDIERMLLSAIELHHDKDGMALPPAIAPFTVVITPVNFADTAQREAALRLYGDCQAAGIEVLLDDRNERAGVKFKEADLIGVPYRITAGRKIADGTVEFLERRSRKSEELPVDVVVAELLRRLL